MSLRSRVLAVVVVALATFAVAAPRALAHPHIWIDAFVEVLHDGPRIAGLRINWTFDPFFSGMAAADFDTDGDSMLDDDEAARLAETSAETLKDSGFFTHIWLNGELVQIDAVRDFKAWVRDKRLSYAFTVAFPEPIDPATTTLDVSLYDPTYYIEINMDAVDPLRFAGGSPSCLINVQPDPQRTIYFGLVRPTLMQLLCAAS